MKEITIEVSDQPNFKFEGCLIACEGSTGDRSSMYYSGHTGRWDEYYLYKTKSNKYICQHTERTDWAKERDKTRAIYCTSIEKVIQFFGHGWLAKELYYTAGIDDSIRIA